MKRPLTIVYRLVVLGRPRAIVGRVVLSTSFRVGT